MSPLPLGRTLLGRFLCCTVLLVLAPGVSGAQQAPPPAYIVLVEGAATLEREGEVTAAVQNMPLIPGDRVRTTAGRVEIRFPDGTGIEVGEYSEIELLTTSRVRLLAGTLDRLEPLPVDTQSAPYLPQGLQMYGSTFDRYGTWGYAPPYGYVWYPSVAPDWRPYYHGYWEPVRSYGWTWIGTDVWSWPTHHYGRWGHTRNAWFWIPDRTFGPAWVSWGAATGFVSWCPLGFDNRPVFAMSIGYGNAWAGWTVLPRTHFGVRGYYVDRFAVSPHGLPRHAAFVTQSSVPVPLPRHITNGGAAGEGVAVPRGLTRSAGASTSPPSGFAVPRGESRPSTVERQPSPAGRALTRERWSTIDDQRGTSDRRLRTNDYRGVGAPAVRPSPDYGRPQAVPRWPTRDATPQPAPSVGQPAPQPAPSPFDVGRGRPGVPRMGTSLPPGSFGVPRANVMPPRVPSGEMPRASTPIPPPAPAGSFGVPRVNAMPPRAPSGGMPRASAPMPAPAPAPPPQAAPQRSAPAGAAPAGTAVPRSGGGGGQAAERRRG